MKFKKFGSCDLNDIIQFFYCIFLNWGLWDGQNYLQVIIIQTLNSLMRTTGALDIQKKKPQPHNDIFFNKKIVAPQKLKILVLSGNDIITDELQFLHKCTNLLKLDLSHNNISKIPQKIGLQKLTKLQILYLHHNKIENAIGLEGVFALQKLVHLTIRDNPVDRLPRIEHLIVNVMPSLKVIGDRVVFVEERSPGLFQTRNSVFVEMEIMEGWRVKDNSQAHYMKILELQLKYFDNVWVHNNPIIRIQRSWRKCLSQKHKKRLNERRKKLKQIEQQQQLPSQQSTELSKLKQILKEWKKFTENRKSIKYQLASTQSYPTNKIYMTYPLIQYHRALRNLRVERVIKNYVKSIRDRIFVRKMAERLYRQLKRKSIQFNGPESFYYICKINETHRFYFNKIQGHLLDNFLCHLKQNFNWSDPISKQCKRGQATNYLSIRTVDPQTFSVKTIYSVFTYTIWPSMKAIFLKKKKFESKHKTGIIKIKPLSYIKNQNKILTKQEYKKTLKVYKQLQKFYRKQYQNSLDYFQCQNQHVMKMLLRYIFYHNSKTYTFQKKVKKNDMQSLLENYQEPFLIYADCVLERTAAAVRIQQNWRKYLVHKNSAQSIYTKMKKTRAAYRIQRFWRDRVFYHRLSFQRNISYQLKLFNSNSFLIPHQLYLKLPQICQQTTENQLYPNFHLTCLPTPTRTLTPKWKYNKPTYSPNILNKYFPSLSKQQQYSDTNNEQYCDCWNILHVNANIVKIQCNGKMYYQFKFVDQDSARFRIYLLALMSYRCYGGRYFLPLGREMLDLCQLRFQQYYKLGLIQIQDNSNKDTKNNKTSKNSLKTKQPKLTKQSTGKINILKSMKQYGNLKQPVNYQTKVEFYQKTYQDFPKKYTADLFYTLPQSIEIQKKVQKEKIVEQFISNKYIQIDDVDGGADGDGQKQAVIKSDVVKNQDNFMNVSKIDKKRLSLYDFGGRVEMKKSHVKPKTSDQFMLEHVDRKQNVSRIKMQQTTRKQQMQQRKAANLKKMREEVQKQKNLNSTMKNIKQIQRTEQLRKKIERIKQMKSRVSSLRKQDHEQDFIQQGNFVMQQQLKMIIMRTKIQSIKPKTKDKDKDKDRDRSEKSEVSSNKNSQKFSKSFYTEERNKQIQVFSHPHHQKPVVHSLGATLVNNNIGVEESVVGDDRKIVNVRNQRRSKSRSIGAYLRDPSLVHGVFPEEYYPIETKQGGNFKFFPPLI